MFGSPKTSREQMLIGRIMKNTFYATVLGLGKEVTRFW